MYDVYKTLRLFVSLLSTFRTDVNYIQRLAKVFVRVLVKFVPALA